MPQRAFETARVLFLSLLNSTTPGNHVCDILKLLGSYFGDCSQWHNEAQDRNTALQQQTKPDFLPKMPDFSPIFLVLKFRV